jgi:hypothetical protein
LNIIFRSFYLSFDLMTIINKKSFINKFNQFYF